MKNVLYLVSSLLLVSGCTPSTENAPAPIAPITFAVEVDSIKLDPYGYAPRSALVSFSVATVGKTFIRVRGKHGSLTNVEHTFNDKGTYHAIPVIGLYANYRNTVDIRILNNRGDTLAQSTLTIQTGDLPPNMPVSITALPFEESQIAPGLILVSNYSTRGTGSPSTPFFMDAYGDIRWVLNYRRHSQLKSLGFVLVSVNPNP